MTKHHPDPETDAAIAAHVEMTQLHSQAPRPAPTPAALAEPVEADEADVADDDEAEPEKRKPGRKKKVATD